MGKRGALAAMECFFVLPTLSKVSLYEVFMHYFKKISSASGATPQISTGTQTLDPAGDFCPSNPSLPTPGKNPVGAHVFVGLLDK